MDKNVNCAIILHVLAWNIVSLPHEVSWYLNVEINLCTQEFSSRKITIHNYLPALSILLLSAFFLARKTFSFCFKHKNLCHFSKIHKQFSSDGRQTFPLTSRKKNSGKVPQKTSVLMRGMWQIMERAKQRTISYETAKLSKVCLAHKKCLMHV